MHDLELHAFAGAEEVLQKEKIQTFPSKIIPKAEDVTLVTQFSVNRFERFEGIVANWKGPISAVVYLVNPWDIFTFWDYLQATPESTLGNVTFTLARPDYRVDFRHYPINRLRNIGIKAAETNYIFVIDADFRPTTKLYEYVVKFVLPEIKVNPKHAFAVAGPAIRESYQGEMPDNVEELRKLFKEKMAYVPSLIGHGATKYDVFLDQ